jgi:hypothetical protein
VYTVGSNFSKIKNKFIGNLYCFSINPSTINIFIILNFIVFLVMGVQKSKKSKKYFFLKKHEIKILREKSISNSTKQLKLETNFLSLSKK